MAIDRFKKIFSISSVGILLSSFLVLGNSTAVSAQIIEPEECFPAVLMLKGSGEGLVNGDPVGPETYYPTDDPNTPYLATNGHEGEIISRLLQSFVDYTDLHNSSSFSTEKVRFIGIEYLANDVPFDFSSASNPLEYATMALDQILKYDYSYRDGASKILSQIVQDQSRGCDTQYMLLSYSQGVISARIAASLLNNTDKIVSSYSIGDPFKKPTLTVDPRQSSSASTSPYTPGVGIWGSELVKSSALGIAVSNPGLSISMLDIANKIDKYVAGITKSNDFMYKIGPDEFGISRSICHVNDPVCSTLDLDNLMTQHMNYFESNSTAGAMDIAQEVEEFDRQVRMLAGSQLNNPRVRGLEGTDAVDGKVLYNVTNVKYATEADPDGGDRCYWDLNSDGIEDANFPTDCLPLTATQASSTTVVTVRVVDKFGNTYFASHQSEFIHKDLIDKFSKLDPNKWYQLRSIEDNTKCLAFTGQDNYENITTGVEASVENCEASTASNFTEKAALSKQAFQASPHHASNYPGEADEFGTMLAWGYDEAYNIDSANSQAFEGPLELQKNDDYSSHHFEPRLAKVENGIPYYFIRHRDGNCVTIDDFDKVNINWGCDGYPERQLFAATPLEGEFGNLSLEKDTTAPTQIENLEVSDIVYGSAKLSWEASVDDRLGDVKYEVYREPDVGSAILVDTTSDTEVSLQTSVIPGMSYRFSVVAVDASGNNSEKSEVRFSSYDPLSKPPVPTLESMSGLGDEIVINFPYSDTEPIEKIAIYKDYDFLEFSTGHLYTDSGLTPGQYYSYTYKTVTSQGIYSDMSDNLSIHSVNSVAPTAPSNLELEWPVMDIVWLKWDSSVDDTDSELKYHIYRDGIKLKDSSFASDGVWKGYDEDPIIGATHIYTIQAEDSYGNLSDFSNELTVEIPVPDTTPPTPPSNLSASYMGNNVVSLSWNPGTDDVDSYLYYHLYRDGQRLTEDAWAGENGGEDFTVVPGETYVYTLKAVDYSGNMSEFSEPLTVTIPLPDTEAPTKPILTLTSVNSNQIVFHIESSDNESVNHYQVYRNGELYSNVYGLDDTFTDYSIEMNQLYEYAVKAVDPSGNESDVSDLLLVDTHDTTAPTPPTGLNGYYSYGPTVHLSWNPAEDNNGWIAAYYLYRDGVKLTENFYAHNFGGADYSAQLGNSYTYTVVAEDSSGNLSVESEPVIVTIPETQGEGEDTIPPTKPELSLLDASSVSVAFSISSQDDQGIGYFEIYRDGVFLTTVNEPFYYDNNLTPETSYEYTVVAKDYYENASEMSDAIVITTAAANEYPDPEDPPATIIPKVQTFNLDYVAHNAAQISWTIDDSTGLVYRYDVYRNGVLVAENRDWNPYEGGINTERYSYTDIGIEANTAYTYEVVIKNYGGQSSEISDPFVVQTPEAPIGHDTYSPSKVKVIIHNYQTDYGVVIGWTPGIDDTGVGAYKIYRDGVLIHTMPVDENYFGPIHNDGEVLGGPNPSYTYQISVVDTAGNEGPLSDPVEIAITN